ncbi:MAG: hypothetical protein R2874_03985 [Desulfobacterales bacterium]
MFGGQVLGQALSAATQTVDDTRAPTACMPISCGREIRKTGGV